MMSRLARVVAHLTGSTGACLAAFGFVVAWLVGGFVRRNGFDADYQLLLNSPTTALTFLMVFLIQRAQSADTKALHLKLDELVRAVDGARNDVAGIEDRGEEAITEARR